MRQHIFVTGPPGVGKSTLIHRVLEQLQLTGSCPASSRGTTQPPSNAPRASAAAAAVAVGFYTEEVRAGGERQGFDVVTLDGHRGPLARVGTVRRVSNSTSNNSSSSPLMKGQVHRMQHSWERLADQSNTRSADTPWL
jgi:hypothetical protein